MYTADSSFIGYKPLAQERIAQYLSDRPYATYTLVDFRTIVNDYDIYAEYVNLDPYIILAQMCHETDYARSWWSQRPRRNPAGIRVTGERKLHLSPKDTPSEWQYDEQDKLYKRGLSFTSWQKASKTHIGHLCCYIFHDEEMTPNQTELSYNSPNKAILSALKYRGVAKNIRGLNGRWAYPGTVYADKLAIIANMLEKVGTNEV